MVVFEPQIGILLYNYLKSHYNKKFVFDYRDISVDRFFKKRFKNLLDVSEMVAISSPGFKRVLPSGFDYIISHNISKAILFSRIHVIPPFKTNNIIISNIGLIRDIEANMEIVEALKNNKNIILKFVGKDSEKIEKLTKNITNVECLGFYNKEDEIHLTMQTDFINLFFPDVLNYSINLANRFYKALICKRPLIVRSNTVHADFVTKYKLGIVIENCSELEQKLCDYTEGFDFGVFSKNTDLLLKEIISDYYHFRNQFSNFLQYK